ncbi:hypothetical protein SAMN05216420_10413 [Nitrosospira sp. Nl5]|uniref:hypothetical protein n=1 Tax=Nitrosospira sp. Nl5 TaxID=200120 RepID=UPI00087FCB82|nr:hypothetical protein [Nitrosospira sp. Nl5]SCY25673.1 hypothetical protein SAMN05216420_10413 [Nitrosospira sp. Nl5]
MATSQINLPILGGVRDSTNPPGMAWVGARPYLLFDGTTDELITWSFRMPSDYASGLAVKWQYSMLSATTGVVRIGAQVMAASDGDNIDTDSYDTQNTPADVTVPATAGLMGEISLAFPTVDSLAAGDYISVQLRRENAVSPGTNATGDMEVWAIALTYTTT